jgi:hypothetical protein
MTKSEYQEVDVEVTIDVDDVVEYIKDYAGEHDLKEIRETLSVESPLPTGTLVDVMKLDLFRKVSEKYTLEQLEELLDIKYY